MFMDFLRSLSIFGEKASPERIQELLEVVEGQADLDAQFNVRKLSFKKLMHHLASSLRKFDEYYFSFPGF